MAQSNLKAKLLEKIEAHRPRTTKLNKEFGNVIIDKVNIGQCIGGARDVRSLVTDISYLDPIEGIRFRGKTIPETFEALPKAENGAMYPTVEAFCNWRGCRRSRDLWHWRPPAHQLCGFAGMERSPIR